jgi:hypothetical protein
MVPFCMRLVVEHVVLGEALVKCIKWVNSLYKLFDCFFDKLINLINVKNTNQFVRLKECIVAWQV